MPDWGPLRMDCGRGHSLWNAIGDPQSSRVLTDSPFERRFLLAAHAYPRSILFFADYEVEIMEVWVQCPASSGHCRPAGMDQIPGYRSEGDLPFGVGTAASFPKHSRNAKKHP